MSSIVKSEFFNRAYVLLTTRIVYHALFWFSLLLLLIFIEGVGHDFWFTLSNELINVFFYALVVYFNLFYLIPNYLNKSKIFTYLGLLILVTIIITPLKVIVLYFKFADQPALQATLVHNQNLYFLSTFLIGGASTVFNIMTDWARGLRNKSQLEKETIQSELQFLKSQINPHFLFNTLNNLYALTLKKSEKAPEIVIKLSEMLRYMLYECNEKYVPLFKEINYLSNYLDLEKLRQGQHVEITLSVEGNPGNLRIAPLMFITFLENCFKHGLSHHISKGYVHTTIRIENHTVDFQVTNSKPDSLPNQEHRRPGGIGLVNVKRRLALLYPRKHELTITDSPNSFTVQLIIRLD